MIQTLQIRLLNGIGRLRSGDGLRSRLARGGLWLGAGSGAENGLRIVRNMILTRLLVPEAFGLMAIVLAINGAFEAFTEIGLKEAVVQSPHGATRPYLNAAWWLALGRGLVLYGVASLAAPWIVHFYGQPQMLPMLRVALLSIIFNGALSARAYVALKEMNYGPWVLINQGGNTLGILTAITLGLLYHNVWALVIGFLAEAAARCLLSYAVCPYRPRLVFQRESIRALLHYAGGMIGLPVLTLLYAKADVFVVGKLLSTAELGLYSMAAALAFIPDVLCGTVVAPLLMPAFSTLQHDREQLNRSLLHSLKLLTALFLPVLTLMACAAPYLLRGVYGPAYGAVSLTFMIFCAAMAFRIIGWGLVTTFFATGRPELSRRASVVRLAVLLATIFPLVRHLGLAGAALAGLLSGLAWVAFNIFYLRKTIGLSVARYFAALVPGILASAAAAGLWILIGRLT